MALKSRRRVDPSAEAFTRQGIHKRGVEVLFQRVSGFAPNTSTFSAKVVAMVSDVQPDTGEESSTGYGSTRPGSISQDDRSVIVMAADLVEKRFPLPLQKHDRMIVVESGDKYDVTRVNALKRAMSGAIELTVVGVA